MTSSINDAQANLKKAGSAAVSDAMKDPNVLMAAADGMNKVQAMTADAAGDDDFKAVDE